MSRLLRLRGPRSRWSKNGGATLLGSAPGYQRFARATASPCARTRSAIEPVVLPVGHHIGGRGHPVRQVEETHRLGQIEYIGLAEANAPQGRSVRFLDEKGRRRQFPGEIEHGALARRERR